MAVVHSGAAHEAAHHLRRIVAQLLEHGLGGEIPDLLIGHIRNNEILPHGQPDLAAAIILGQTRSVEHLPSGDSAHRYRKADIVQSLLLLSEDPDVICIFVAESFVFAGRQQGSIRSSL